MPNTWENKCCNWMCVLLLAIFPPAFIASCGVIWSAVLAVCPPNLCIPQLACLWVLWEEEKDLSLCKQNSATAKTPFCCQHSFGQSKTQPRTGYYKKPSLQNIIAKARTSGIHKMWLKNQLTGNANINTLLYLCTNLPPPNDAIIEHNTPRYITNSVYLKWAEM